MTLVILLVELPFGMVLTVTSIRKLASRARTPCTLYHSHCATLTHGAPDQFPSQPLSTVRALLLISTGSLTKETQMPILCAPEPNSITILKGVWACQIRPPKHLAPAPTLLTSKHTRMHSTGSTSTNSETCFLLYVINESLSKCCPDSYLFNSDHVIVSLLFWILCLSEYLSSPFI